MMAADKGQCVELYKLKEKEKENVLIKLIDIFNVYIVKYFLAA